MKITIVGNHCTWTKELSTSFIINDDMLLDVPQGSFKTLYRDYGLDNISYILITHFHSDHFADLHLVLEILKRQTRKITILAPKTCKERLISLFYAFDVPYLKKYVEDNIEFIECENGKTYKIGHYKIKAYKMIHGELDAYGYIIDDGGNGKAGFSGDTCMCNNLHKIVKHSKVAFVDMSNIDKGLKHLTPEEVLQLKNEYKDTILYPVHLYYTTKAKVKEYGLNQTYEGQVIEIN